MSQPPNFGPPPPNRNAPHPQQQQRQPNPYGAPTSNHAFGRPSDPPPAPPSYPPPPSTASSSSSRGARSSGAAPPSLSTESPLPPVVQRCLGDRSYDKRKNAALEVEALVKSLHEANNTPMIRSILSVLSKDFCTSMNANYRKGGLIGIAAAAIGLMRTSRSYLDELLPPVLHCFDDPESRVRYYACESLYNIAKVARTTVLPRYFHPMFDGLCKLYADPDLDVKNGAGLLDRLIKDIVTESDDFRVEHFVPPLQKYINRSNPYIRQLLVGWITVLDSIPDINMIDHLPDFLDGLFNMLSDSNREIRQAADAALSEFLREIRQSTVVEFGPVVRILVNQCRSRDRLNRLTAIVWLGELIHHPTSGGDALLPFHASVLEAVMSCLDDAEVEIRHASDRAHQDLLGTVGSTRMTYPVRPLLDALLRELDGGGDDKNNDSSANNNNNNNNNNQNSDPNDPFSTVDEYTNNNNGVVPVCQMASLRWINMLLERRPAAMNVCLDDLLPVLLRTLTNSSDDVVLLNLRVLARIAVLRGDGGDDDDDQDPRRRPHFRTVLNAVLALFAEDRPLLETRGSLIVRRLCVLLDAEDVFVTTAASLNNGAYPPDFVSTMVQTLNLILLSAAETHGLRSALHQSDDRSVFASLFHCWCHNPVSTLALCLLARAYDLAHALVRRFAELDVRYEEGPPHHHHTLSVGLLMQTDKLVGLLESPAFVHLRLQLLDVEAPHHAALLKSCYGLLMLLPQSEAFRTLSDRLTTVCRLRDSLGARPAPPSKTGLDRESRALLDRFDDVMRSHRERRNAEMREEERRRLDGTAAEREGHVGKTSTTTTWNGVVVRGDKSDASSSAPADRSAVGGAGTGAGDAGRRVVAGGVRDGPRGAPTTAPYPDAAGAQQRSAYGAPVAQPRPPPTTTNASGYAGGGGRPYGSNPLEIAARDNHHGGNNAAPVDGHRQHPRGGGGGGVGGRSDPRRPDDGKGGGAEPSRRSAAR